MSFCERPQLTCAILNPLWDTFTSIRNQLPSQNTIVQFATEHPGKTAAVATALAPVAIAAIGLCCLNMIPAPTVRATLAPGADKKSPASPLASPSTDAVGIAKQAAAKEGLGSITDTPASSSSPALVAGAGSSQSSATGTPDKSSFSPASVAGVAAGSSQSSGTGTPDKSSSSSASFAGVVAGSSQSSATGTPDKSSFSPARAKKELPQSRKDLMELRFSQNSLPNNPNFKGAMGDVYSLKKHGKLGYLMTITSKYLKDKDLSNNPVLVWTSPNVFQFGKIVPNGQHTKTHVQVYLESSNQTISNLPIRDVFLIKQAPAEGKHAGN